MALAAIEQRVGLAADLVDGARRVAVDVVDHRIAVAERIVAFAPRAVGDEEGPGIASAADRVVADLQIHCVVDEFHAAERVIVVLQIGKRRIVGGEYPADLLVGYRALRRGRGERPHIGERRDRSGRIRMTRGVAERRRQGDVDRVRRGARILHARQDAGGGVGEVDFAPRPGCRR